jgi:hypothetical protein
MFSCQRIRKCENMEIDRVNVYIKKGINCRKYIEIGRERFIISTARLLGQTNSLTITSKLTVRLNILHNRYFRLLSDVIHTNQLTLWMLLVQSWTFSVK